MEEPLHQLIVNIRLFTGFYIQYISGGAGCLSSTVSHTFGKTNMAGGWRYYPFPIRKWMDPFLHGPIFSILGLYGNIGVSRERIILEYSGPAVWMTKKSPIRTPVFRLGPDRGDWRGEKCWKNGVDI